MGDDEPGLTHGDKSKTFRGPRPWVHKEKALWHAPCSPTRKRSLALLGPVAQKPPLGVGIRSSVRNPRCLLQSATSTHPALQGTNRPTLSKGLLP